jgi:hypothetical protein
MHFAYHSVTRNAVIEFGRDLARAQALVPELFELFDPFIGPGHCLSLKDHQRKNSIQIARNVRRRLAPLMITRCRA